MVNTAIRHRFKKYKEIDMQSVRDIVDSYDPSVPREEVSQ